MADFDDVPATKTRLAEIRKLKSDREAAAEASRDAAEVAHFELVERFEKELGGVEGEAFEVVDLSALGEGFVVLKLGPGVLFNTYRNSKMTVVDTDSFVGPCVAHPTIADWRSLVSRRPFVGDRCAIALSGLYGSKKASDTEK